MCSGRCTPKGELAIHDVIANIVVSVNESALLQIRKIEYKGLPMRRFLRRNASSGVLASGSAVRIRIHQGGGTKGPGRSIRTGANKSYRPGDTVKQSGIYEVVHDREHRATHDVVMISGDAFPICETCDQNVRFRLVRTAPYIFQDQDFEEDDK